MLLLLASLLVVSVDGLDNRYLKDADQLGLRIPNLRKLLKEGAVADGVVGVAPSITWPSHTTLITGVRPDQHGIRGNKRPASEGGQYYWTTDLLKVKTLWHATRAAGLKSAAVTWPVTVGADIDFNLPEKFDRRNGGGMDLAAIEKAGTPGLVQKISSMFPSFPQEWMDDRTRTQAVVYLLKVARPDLILLHLVDHDAAAHAYGPFTTEAKAAIEYTDELLGQMLAAKPREMTLAVVSDHGFEQIDRELNPVSKFGAKVTVSQGLAVAQDEATAAELAKLDGVGRRVPQLEIDRFAPFLGKPAAAFEPVEHTAFSADPKAALFSKPKEIGEHGLWPAKPNYRSVFLLWGAGITPQRLPELDMLAIAERFAQILKVRLTN